MKTILFILALLPAHALACFPTVDPDIASPKYIPHLYQSSAGVSIGWFCKTNAGVKGPIIRVLPIETMPTNWQETARNEAEALNQAKDKASYVQALETRYKTLPDCSKATGNHKALCDQSFAHFMKFRPPNIEFIVGAATSQDGTRPAYLFTNGVRGTMAVARAKSGDPCDCLIKSNETTRYCAVNNRKDIVSVCVAK